MFREFVYSEPNVLICLLTGLSVDVSGGLLLPRGDFGNFFLGSKADSTKLS